MLSEQQCKWIETGLTQEVEPRKVAAYLCLHMGLMLMEVTALQWKDLDLDAQTLTLRICVNAALETVPIDPPRVLHMPPHVTRYLARHSGLYESGKSYILSGKDKLPPFHLMQNILTTVAAQQKLGRPLSVTDLRQVFIRRCIQSGMDLYSLCDYIGIRQPNVIVKKYAQYFQARQEDVDRLEQFSADYQPPEPKPAFKGPKRMNLLILGAGSQGPVVKEIAEAIGTFNQIAFLDDDPNNQLAIGPLCDYLHLADKYPTAIPSFGDTALRSKWFDKLRMDGAGYMIPRLIHPSATISPSGVSLGDGVVIEPKVIIGNHVTVHDNVILSAGCVLDKECVIGANSHIGCSCTITKGSVVPPGSRVPAGTIYGNGS